MKVLITATLLWLLVLASPARAQNVQENGKTAHETAVDGRWEAKLKAEQQPTLLFEFKNTDGVVSGTMTQNGKLTELKNGSLKGTILKFQTTQVSPNGGDPMTMTWTGTLIDDGESMNLTCAATEGDGQTLYMQARRVK